MIKSYFKVAWRNLSKSRLYTSISIVNLLLGITFTMLIGGYIWQEFQVNNHLDNKENQMILTSDWKESNMGIDFTTLAPLAKALKEEYPSLVANYYRWDAIDVTISSKNNLFREAIQIGDNTLLSMYGFQLLYGNPKTALQNPYSVVLTTEKARKYFGRTDVLNETLTIQNFSGETQDFLITGVLKKIPKNSVTHINDNNFNEIFLQEKSLSFFGRDQWEDWSYHIVPSYVELKEGVVPKDLDTPIEQLIAKNTDQRIQENLQVSAVPLKAYYLSKDNYQVERMIYTLSFVGSFILLMALINYVNMSISFSSKRMREIGVRKVLGSSKTQLISQFLVESILFVSIITMLAILCYPLAKPWFEQLVGNQIPTLSSFPLYFAGILFMVILLVGILAGIYPAVLLASLNTVESLQGKFTKMSISILLSKFLIGVQFIVALTVIVTTVLISDQVDYFFGNTLGYNKEYVISIPVPRDWSQEGVQKMETVRNEFVSLSEINAATLSYEIPNGNFGGQVSLHRLNNTNEFNVNSQALVTDVHFAETFQIPLLAGTYFKEGVLANDNVVINEKTQKSLGWMAADEAIGQQIKIPDDNLSYTVIGVIKNFHFGSMAESIEPQIIFNTKTTPIYRYLSIKMNPGNIESSMNAIQDKWKEMFPVTPFEFNFMDDTLKRLYSSEIQLKNATLTACGVSILIVLLGVFGLVSINIKKRLKEIAIRKVLGASIHNISLLFIKEFIPILIIAILIACPLAYILIRNWLSHYAYQTDISTISFIWPTFLITGLILTLIVFQTTKATQATTVNHLKSE